MKFSENWLREWVNPKLSSEQLCHQLTMGGLEVDAFEPVAPEHSGIVIGKIIRIEKHPNADKLNICQVDVGNASDSPLTIVCGGKNARLDLVTACAMVGAKLPGDFKIKKSKIRGKVSLGMLCSASELGLEESSDGIMELAEDAPLGVSLKEYLQLNDHTIELGITPNRSDCLSIHGIARETAVLTQTSLHPIEVKVITPNIEQTMPIELLAKEDCPKYSCRIIKNIDSKATSPLWLQQKLNRSGVRPLSLVVDVTNYVMLELGQPMHAFDLSKIEQKIVIRKAKQGELLELLDGQNIQLDEQNLVIADAKKALALAGIMGGEQTAVSENTQDILLESAYFDPLQLSGKARALGLHTDSSHRFERGVSPELALMALERASGLIVELAGGEVGSVCTASADEYLPHQMQADAAITFNPDKVAKVLGVQLADEQIAEMLSQLEMTIERHDNDWQVIPPAHRFDVQYDVDLIEEIARLYGYDNLPSRQLFAPIQMHAVAENNIPVDKLKQALVQSDYYEVVNYSFIDPKIQNWFRTDNSSEEEMQLQNPIAEDMSLMRTSLLPGLLKSFSYNRNRQQQRIRLFEMGKCFYNLEKQGLHEVERIAGLIYGSRYPEQWSADNKHVVDYYDLKNDVENLLSLGGNISDFRFVTAEHPALHPGQSAKILKGGHIIGWLGKVHPQTAKSLQIKQDQIFLFELDVDAVTEAKIPSFKQISKFPSIRRDIAIIVDKSYCSEDILTAIRENLSNDLIDLLLFDSYTSKNLEENKKSLAIGLVLQHAERTLEEQDIEQMMDQVLMLLEQKFAAKLRD